MENLNIIEFQKTRDFSKKMNATFEFIRQNFKPLTKSLLFIAGPPVLLASFFISSFYGKFFNSAMQGQSMQSDPEAFGQMFTGTAFWLEIIGIMIFAFLAGVFTISVVNNYMKEYAEKRSNKIETNDVWIRVRTTFPMYLGTMILYILALFLTYLVSLIPMVVLTALSPVLAVFGVIIVLCLVVYIWIGLSILFVVRAYENIGFIDSVRRSFYLISGKWWSTFGLIFVTSLISGTIASLFFIPWYINTIVTVLHSVQETSFEEPSAMSKIISNIFLLLYFLASFILQALPLIAISFQYFNLVERKEAKGLLSQIDTFGQETPPPPQNEQY